MVMTSPWHIAALGAVLCSASLSVKSSPVEGASLMRFEMRQASTAFLLTLLVPNAALAAPPAGYYDSVDPSSQTAIRSSIHATIDDHVKFPYTSSNTDTWNILELADEDPEDSGNILDVYENASYDKVGAGNSNYNREHVWPNSYGFPDDGPSNYPYSDCHMLFLSNIGYNSDRGNLPFGTCAECGGLTTQEDGGGGGGAGGGWRRPSGGGAARWCGAGPAPPGGSIRAIPPGGPAPVRAAASRRGPAGAATSPGHSSTRTSPLRGAPLESPASPRRASAPPP